MSKYFALTGDGGGGGGGSYTLPTATANTLGGVKIGENVNITNGKISVDLSAYAKKTLATPTADGLMSKSDKSKIDTMSEYVLPVATDEDLGGVKIGDGIQIANGKISVSFSDYYTKSETDEKILENVPTKLSELQNDENYIKNTADNLLNYYKKAETYSQTEINDIIGNINKLTSEIVTVLPTENISTSTIYLIKAEDTNVYSQYMYISNTWAELGTTAIDLSNYYSKTEIDTKLADKSDVSALTAHAEDVVIHITSDERTAWNEAVSKAHTHANSDILDATEESFTTAKQTAYDKAVEDDHTHENKAVIDKFSENPDGRVLYDDKEIASGNVWHGTKAEYDLIETKDPETTYIVTDEPDTIASYVIDDNTTSDTTTWSSDKISSQKFLMTIPLISFNSTLTAGGNYPVFWDNSLVFNDIIPYGKVTRWRFILTGVSQSEGTVAIGNTAITLKNDQVSTNAAYPKVSTWTSTHFEALVNVKSSVSLYAKELSLQIEYIQN